MDDKLHRERAVRALRRSTAGLAALGVWTFWWSWCLDDPALDGLVPKDELLEHELPLAGELVARGLWAEQDEDFAFVDFHRISPRREQLEHKREADRSRVAERRAESHASRTRHPRDSAPVARDNSATPPPVARDSPACRANVASPARSESDSDPHSDPNTDPIRDRVRMGEEDIPSDESAPQTLLLARDGRQEALEGEIPTEAPGLPLGKHHEALRAQEQNRAAARAAWSENLPQGFKALAKPDNDQGRGAAPQDAEAPFGHAPSADDSDRERPEQITGRFVALYERTYAQRPSLGGKNVWTFPERVRATARLQKVDPLVLLDRAFEAWVNEKRTPEQEQMRARAPYAVFASAFGGLVDGAGKGGVRTPEQQLKRRIAEALALGKQELYIDLNREYATKFLGGGHGKLSSN